MKKIYFPVFLLIIIIFAACEKNEDLVVPTTKIKILMSYSSPVKQNGSAMHAKGSVSENIQKTVTAGDIVDVQNVKDINVILSAEDESGQGLNGTWVIHIFETDRNANDNTIIQNTPNNSEVGSITSIKLTFLGLYRAEFRMKTGKVFYFYIRHTGIPGSVGDNEENNYSFRLDKEIYQVVNDPGHRGYTLYMKYNDSESTRLDIAHAMILCRGNNSFTTKTGSVINGVKEYQLQNCKYSPGYVRVSFLSDEAPDVNGMYRVYFYTGDFGYEWMTFESCDISDWAKGGTIIFQAI